MLGLQSLLEGQTRLSGGLALPGFLLVKHVAVEIIPNNVKSGQEKNSKRRIFCARVTDRQVKGNIGYRQRGYARPFQKAQRQHEQNSKRQAGKSKHTDKHKTTKAKIA